MKTILFPEQKAPYTGCCVALGNFDGVHKGHQAVISACISLAKQMHLSSAVYTFEKHYKAYFGNFNQVITNNCAKQQVIEQLLNPDFLIFQKIDASFLEQTPEEFVQKVLKEQLKAKAVVVGAHYSFGKKGCGNAELLKELCEKAGICAKVVPLLSENGALFSSTSVREFVEAGYVEQANNVLGYDFFLEGEVVHGNHIGSEIGFPTINLVPDKEQLLPAFGVYATVTEMEGKRYLGVTNVGVKPTVGAKMPVVETNLFGISGNFYGKTAKVCFKKQLRPEKRFSGLYELQKQIAEDSAKAKKVLE